MRRRKCRKNMVLREASLQEIARGGLEMCQEKGEEKIEGGWVGVLWPSNKLKVLILKALKSPWYSIW